MNSKEIKKYLHRSELNLEAFKIINFFQDLTKSLKQTSVMIVVLNGSEGMAEETEEWVGFVQTVKLFIKKHLQRNQDITQAALKTMKGQIDEKMDTKFNDLDAKVGALDSKMDSIKAILEDI